MKSNDEEVEHLESAASSMSKTISFNYEVNITDQTQSIHEVVRI